MTAHVAPFSGEARHPRSLMNHSRKLNDCRYLPSVNCSALTWGVERLALPSVSHIQGAK